MRTAADPRMPVAAAVHTAARRCVVGRSTGGLPNLADWAAWFYAAVVIALSGSTGPHPAAPSFESSERMGLELQVRSPGVPGAQAMRGTPGEWSNTRPSSGALPAAPFSAPVLSAHDIKPVTGTSAPDLPRLSSGFLPDRSLAPPHRA